MATKAPTDDELFAEYNSTTDDGSETDAKQEEYEAPVPIDPPQLDGKGWSEKIRTAVGEDQWFESTEGQKDNINLADRPDVCTEDMDLFS